MQLNQGFLGDGFWLRIGLALVAVALAAYIGYEPVGPRNGSTWVGYALGGAALAIVLWLSWLGVMKRRFAASGALRKGTVAAHVWLGLAVVALASLHSGFEFEWSLHTLAYLLLLLVALSGVLGVSVYATLPGRMADNLARRLVEKRKHDLSEREQLELDMAEIDKRLGRALAFLPDRFRDPVKRSLERTRIGGSALRILSGSSRGCGTALALADVRRLAAEGAESDQVRGRVADLIRDLARKSEIADALRRDGRYRAWLSLWLWVHVPLSMALLAALAAHVTLVFFYW